jgi:hypothetical protein
MSMRSTLSRPLRVFRHGPEAPDGAGEPSGPTLVPTVGLTLYTGDSVAFGYLPLSAARVTDLMNEHEEFAFVDTYLESLEDGHELAAGSVVVARDEIFVAAVAGPRGDPKRRTRTRPIPIEMQVGPYSVWGNLHVVPGTDPLMSFRSRRTMVPVTEATVEWDSPDGRRLAQWATVVVNRMLADWIAPARRDVRPRDLQLVPEGESSSRSGDFVSQIARR